MPSGKDLDWYKGRVDYLQSLYEDRDDMYDEIDDARFGNWDLPEDLEGIPWILKSLEPAFAITSNAAVGLIAANEPQINITPANKDQNSIADVHERGLGWILDRASKRRKASVVEEMAGSAVNYAECATLVTHLPTQINAVEARGGNSKKLRAKQRYGDILIRNYHPGEVYPRYSSIGVEEVGLITEENPHDVIDLWGEEASAKLVAYMKENNIKWGGSDVVAMYEYISLDYHVVWVEIDGEKIELHNDTWKWPFIPWACNITGGELLKDTDKDRKPLLSIMYHFDQFDIMNRVKTLLMSDMVREAGRARRAYQSSDPEGTAPRIDNSSGEPYEIIGTEDKIVQHAPVTPDPQLLALYQHLQGDHERATLSNLLLGGEVPSEAAFASVNLITHSALQAIDDARDLLARQIGDVCEIILLWIHYTRSEVYGTVRDPVDRNKIHNYLINWQDIDPQNLFIEVKVDANMPVDQNERVIAGRAMIDAGLSSRQAVMEDIGYTNAREVYMQMVEEQFVDTEVALRLENRRFEMSQELQQEMIANFMNSPEGQQMQQLAQIGAQVLQEQQGGVGELPPGGGTEGPPMEGPQRERMPAEMPVDGLSPSTNPAEGEPPPAVFAPGEGATKAGGAATQRSR